MKIKIYKIIPFLLATTFILSSCSGANEEIIEEVVYTAVETTILENSSIKTELQYAGQIQAMETVAVISKISGTVERTNKNIGDRVGAGEILFTIDRKDVENQIKQLEAQVNVANQSVNSAKNSLNNIEGSQFQSSLIQMESGIESTKTQIENANIALDNATEGYEAAESAFNNAKFLYENGVMSKIEYENTERSFNQAKAGVDQAKNGVLSAETALAQQESTYELTKNKAVEENKMSASLGINQATASVQSAQVQLDIARQSLDDTSTKSPISGIISGKNAITGQIISPQTVAYTVSNIDQVNVQVKISELLINKVAIGEEVEVKINSLEMPLVGIISEINPVADQTSTYPIKITLDNPNHVIKPGMFATVVFETNRSEDTIVLPREAILRDNSINYVYVVENDIAKKVIVETGLDNGENIEIVSGLTLDDFVITKGQTYVSDGETVNVVKGE